MRKDISIFKDYQWVGGQWPFAVLIFHNKAKNPYFCRFYTV